MDDDRLQYDAYRPSPPFPDSPYSDWDADDEGRDQDPWSMEYCDPPDHGHDGHDEPRDAAHMVAIICNAMLADGLFWW